MKNKTIILFIPLLFVCSELLCRILGYSPGNLTPNWSNFKPVDSLIEYHHFYTDTNGLIVANKAYFESMHININREGFRTPEWSSIDTSKKSTLFIGDSFTWGLSADPITGSFVDLVRNQSTNNIINLGIPVADPLQYSVLAERYIPIFKPKQVFIMLYLGNDIMLNKRALKPNQPLYFYTNAGAMQAYDNKTTFSTAQEAYHYYTEEKYFLRHPKNKFEKIVSYSAFLSRLYALKHRWKEKQLYEKSIREMTFTKKQLYPIVSACQAYHCKLYIVLIPELKEANESVDFMKHRYSALFSDSRLKTSVLLPSGNNKSFYTPYPDAHLNNSGHQFYAREILRLLSDSKN
jgi:hypothetical protein